VVGERFVWLLFAENKFSGSEEAGGKRVKQRKLRNCAIDWKGFAKLGLKAWVVK
jgi:hypothetical protein